jgi:hypothetical protein
MLVVVHKLQLGLGRGNVGKEGFVKRTARNHDRVPHPTHASQSVPKRSSVRIRVEDLSCVSFPSLLHPFLPQLTVALMEGIFRKDNNVFHQDLRT